MNRVSNFVSRARFAAAAGLLGLTAALPVAAAEDVTVTVNATIVGVCKFFTAAPVVDINNTGVGSNIDPSLAGPAEGTANISYRCSNGTAPTFTVPSPATVTCTVGTPCSGSPTMAATMTYTGGGNGSGMGAGQNKTLEVKGSIAQASYEDKPEGAYTGTIVVSVSP